MKQRCYYKYARRGFTLLELLVALAMAAALMLPLYQTLRTAYKGKASAEAAMIPSRTSELAMEFLRMDIESALPPAPGSPGYATDSTSTGTAAVAPAASTGSTNPVSLAGSFIGLDSQDDRGHNGDDLTFYTTSDGPEHVAGDGEIKMVELTILVPPGTSDHVLVRRVTRNLLAPQSVVPDDEVICRHVASFNLRYYDGTVWQDSWDSTQQTNELPVAVEVTLELEAAVDAPRNQPGKKFIRYFPIVCSTLVNDANATTTTGTTTGGTTK